MTLQLLWPEYRPAHPDGYQYSWFCEQLQGVAGQLGLVLPQIYRVGEKAFVDHAGPKFPVVDRRTGEVRDAIVFVGVLRASNYTVVDVVEPRAAGLDDIARQDVRVLGRGPLGSSSRTTSRPRSARPATTSRT